MLQAAQGEFKVRGRRSREGQVVFDFAYSDIEPDTAEWLKSQLVSPRENFIALPGMEAPQNLSLLDDLAQRGALMHTFRFSIYLKGREPERVTKFRVLRVVPSMLRLQWGLDPVDRTPDMVGTWHLPASKRDLNRLFWWYSGFLRVRERGQTHIKQFNEELAHRGFALETLKLQVRFPTVG